MKLFIWTFDHGYSNIIVLAPDLDSARKHYYLTKKSYSKREIEDEPDEIIETDAPYVFENIY